jgi:HEAT repeat protein
MPIKFRCPNPACQKALTVSDGAAGRAGQCPACGGALVVPRPEDPGEDLDGPAIAAGPEPAFGPVAAPRAAVKSTPPPADDLDWDAVGAPGGGPVVSFDAFGLGWGLLKRRMGTWVLAVLVVGLAQMGCQIALSALSFVAGVGVAMVGGPVSLTTLAAMAVGLMIQGVLAGGLSKMALKQIDGGDISVGDVFTVGGAATGLALAWLMVGLGTYLGLALLVIPGVVFAGLAMFTVPAVVEGLGPVEALRRSVGTLGRQWLSAAVFALVSWLLVAAGALLCGVGLLFTLPWYVLAGAVQYRRSFAPGGVPRKSVVADPWAEAVGAPAGASGSGRVPAWAWAVLGLGVAVPVIFVAAAAVLVVSAARQAADQAVVQQQLRRQMGGAAVAPGRPPAAFPAAVAPAGLVQQALDRIAQGGDPRAEAVRWLPGLAAFGDADRHRAAVVAALRPLLREPDLGPDAARALEAWAGPGDAPALIDGLGAGDPRIRVPLIRALGRLKAEEAIPVLAERMAAPQDRGDAARALQAIGPRAAPEVRKLLTHEDRDTRLAAASLLRQFGGDGRDTQLALALAALKSPVDGERQRALQDLGRAAVVDESRDEVLAATLPLLKDPDAATRRRAFTVIRTWGAAEQVPAFIDALDDPDRNVRAMAVAALRKVADQRSALALAQRLATPELRTAAAEALVAMKPQDAEVEAEVLKALDSPDTASRLAACQVLRVVGTAASVPALRRAAGDEQRGVARAARTALAAIDPSGMPAAQPPRSMPRGPARKKR